VPEEEYRQDHALSYSTLAKYEREGFNKLSSLFDRVETASLTFGSAVDSIITGGMKEFEERFLVCDLPDIPDSIIALVKSLYNLYGTTYNSLYDMPDKDIIEITEVNKYQLNWKPETRAKVIKDKGQEYYNMLFISEGKTILSKELYQEVINTVTALKESSSTKFYFTQDNPFEPHIERLYQLKFKGVFDNVPYKIMADLIIVNHEEKWIQPIDLKTSSHTEWDFYKSFISYNYDIQARLYWAVIKQNIENNDYFKDFTLLDYKFIVVNKNTLTPLVWYYPYTTFTDISIECGKNNQITLRSPLEIGKELFNYISSRPTVPNGINKNDSNNIVKWLKTL
jgi:hypothetical protein